MAQSQYHAQSLRGQPLDPDPLGPPQGHALDSKCACCPYGYHIDLDFIDHCRGLESASMLTNLRRIQRNKKQLRKSMEIMLNEQGYVDESSVPPDVVTLSDAGRLVHMVNLERSATRHILRQIDTTVTAPDFYGGADREYAHHDSDGYNSQCSTSRWTVPHGYTRDRRDSFGSISSQSTASSDTPMFQADLRQGQTCTTISGRAFTQVVENPVLEMATAEMKHYSTTSVMEMATAEMKHYSTTSSAQLVDNESKYGQPWASPDRNTFSEILAISPEGRGCGPMSGGEVLVSRETLALCQQQIRELKEQVKTISILQVRISVLKEEKRLLTLQLKANKSNPPTTSVGVGEDTIDKNEQYPIPRKQIPTSSVGVGDHLVTEPYLLQSHLPTGYTVVDNETTFEIISSAVLRQERLTLHKTQLLVASLSHQPGRDWPRDSSQTINHIQISSPKPLMRSIGTGDENVFQGSGLALHQKEVKMVLIGQCAVAKRNVGVECRPLTRDVGVSFMSESDKPQTRTVGVNVSYDTTCITRSLEFKGETHLIKAIEGVLHKNVRSVATSCSIEFDTSEAATMTDPEVGVTIGCGDDDMRVDVEIRLPVVRKAVAVLAKPVLQTKRVNTGPEWALEAGTNTCQTEMKHVEVITDKPGQMTAFTNTELNQTRTATSQTEQTIFINLDQIKDGYTNTEPYQTRTATNQTEQPRIKDGCSNTESITTRTVTNQTEQKFFICLDQIKDAYCNTEPHETRTSTNQTEQQVFISLNQIKDGYSNTEQKPTRTATNQTEQKLIKDGFSNTEPNKTQTATNQTEQKVFISLDQIKNSHSNTDLVSTSSKEAFTDVIVTSDVCVNTETDNSEDRPHKPVETTHICPAKALSVQRTTTESEGCQSHVDGALTSHVYYEDKNIQPNFPSRIEDRIIQEHTTYEKSCLESKSLKKSKFSSSTVSEGGTSYSSLLVSARPTTVLTGKSTEKESRKSLNQRQPDENSDDRFSETIVEHYLITQDGKKLLSEEKITTSSAGTNRSFKQYADGEFLPGHTSETVLSGPISEKKTDSENSALWEKEVTRSSTETSQNIYKTVGNLAEMSSRLGYEGSKISSDLCQVSEISSGQVSESIDSELQHTKLWDNVSGKKSFEKTYKTRQIGSVEDLMSENLRTSTTLASHISAGCEEIIPPKSSSVTATATSTHRGQSFEHTITTENSIVTEGSRMRDMRTLELLGDQPAGVNIETDGLDLMATCEGSTNGRAQKSLITDIKSTDAGSLSSSFSKSQSTFSHTSSKIQTDYSQTSFSTSESFSLQTATGSSTQSACESTLTADVGEMMSYGSLDRRTGLLKSILKHQTGQQCAGSGRGITFAESVTGGMGSSSEENCEEETGSDSSASFEDCSQDGQEAGPSDLGQDDVTLGDTLARAQMKDQNIRERYELPADVRNACSQVAASLTTPTQVQTAELPASEDVVRQAWFQVSSHRLSSARQVEDFLSSATEISRQLLEYLVNLTDLNGNTALHYSLSHGNFEVASLLLDSAVCDVNKRNLAGCTPIMLTGLATVKGEDQDQVIRKLLSQGDINARASNTGQTTLMLAASQGLVAMVKLLVEEGADLNLQDQDGSTALMCACEHGHQEVVSVLLAQPSTDANITDNENSTAVHIAMKAGHKDIGMLLYKRLNFSKLPSPTHRKKKSSSSLTTSNPSTM